MTAAPENDGFEGVLGRANITGARAILRFYEYSFSTDANATPVFMTEFRQPRFVEADVAPLIGAEVEVALLEDRVEVTEIYGDRKLVLPATSIVAQRVAYDHEDYIGRVRTLDTAYAQLNIELVKARKKNNEGHKLVNELVRRSEIKSAASEDLRQRQAAAIAVLQRLLTHFATDD